MVAKTMIGTNAVVSGKCAVFERTDEAIKLYLENGSQPQPFMVIVPYKRVGVFTNLDSCVGRTIEVSGRVKDGEIGSHIVMTNLAQLRVHGADTLGEEVEIRVAALESALDNDQEMNASKTIGHLLCHSCSSRIQEEVARRLSRFPVAVKPPEVSEYADNLVDDLSGKIVTFWSIRIAFRSVDEVRAQVNSRQHMVKGYGQLITLKKQNGKWVVVSREANWIS